MPINMYVILETHLSSQSLALEKAQQPTDRTQKHIQKNLG